MGKGERRSLLYELCNLNSFLKLVLPGAPGRMDLSSHHVTCTYDYFREVTVLYRFPCHFLDPWFSNYVPGSEEEVPQELLQASGKGPDVAASPRLLTSFLQQLSIYHSVSSLSSISFQEKVLLLKGSWRSPALERLGFES